MTQFHSFQVSPCALRLVVESSQCVLRFCLFFPELKTSFRVGCSTKCTLLRWSRGCQSNSVEASDRPATLDPESRWKAPAAALSTESHCVAVRCSYPLLAWRLDPPRSGSSSSAAIQLLPHLVIPPQSRNSDCSHITEGRPTADAGRGLPSQRGKAWGSSPGVAMHGNKERTSSRCPSSAAVKCGSCPKPSSSGGTSNEKSSVGVV